MQTAAVHEIEFTPATGSAADEDNGGRYGTGRHWLPADEILTKPVTLDRLLERIEYHLQRRDDG